MAKESTPVITFVAFRSPVNFTSVGLDSWSPTDRKCDGVTCQDKGTHLAFALTVQGKRRRIRVPLTNIGQVTEEFRDEPEDTP